MRDEHEKEQRKAEAQAAQATMDNHPLEDMNEERGERQGLQSELEDQPKPEQANQDVDEMAREQSQGKTAQQRR